MLPFIRSSYLNSLLESLATGVVIVNIRGNVYAANASAARMMGLSREELLSSSLNGPRLDRFENRAEVQALLDEALDDTRIPATGDILARYDHPELGLRHFTLAVSRLVEYEKIFGVILQLSDLSHIYDLHQRQSRLQQERIDGLARLSMSIAHQVRNPLMTIGGFTRLLMKRADMPEPSRNHMDIIMEAAMRLEDVVQAVTQFTASRQPAPQLLDAAGLARGVLAAMPAPPSGVAVGFDGEGATLTADPAMTADALREVLANAFEALPAGGGSVRVRCAVEKDFVRIEVLDDGPGIAADHLPFVFDPFFTTTSVGVGMGLAKARKWMRDQGGELEISPIQEGGTLAVLRLPGGDGLKPAGK
ncbi:two-component system sensor histidine kinase NtrB [Fundidesulfovibrio soli]|uniref:two-component system sensor histidine kinase NtrB n=1 Tax=Fundidesulfovibrio soli TaxID=2922716 RepID=UPI001FAEEE09|nr:ATP-binding protein [Fundidesulfovibrio soli]